MSAPTLRNSLSPILAGVLSAALAMAVFWLLTVPRAGEGGMGATVKPESLAKQGPLPSIAIHTLDGARITNADLEGKVAVLHFWGTTCPPCVAELPTLRETWRTELAGDPNLAFVAVASDQNVRTLERFMQARGIDWPVAATVDEETYAVWATLNVDGTPSTVIVDKTGQVRWTGGKLPANLPAIIDTLAAE